MVITDIIFVSVAVLMIFSGWRSGFVRALGGVVALIGSIAAAVYTMNWLSVHFDYSFAANPWVAIVTFPILSAVAHWIAMRLVHVLDLARKVIAIVPFVNSINALLGAAFGALQAVLFLLCFTYIVVVFLPTSDVRNEILSSISVSKAIDIETQIGLL